jgi:hypothetical protein
MHLKSQTSSRTPIKVAHVNASAISAESASRLSPFRVRNEYHMGESVYKLVKELKDSALERGDMRAAERLWSIQTKVSVPAEEEAQELDHVRPVGLLPDGTPKAHSAVKPRLAESSMVCLYVFFSLKKFLCVRLCMCVCCWDVRVCMP